MVEPIKIFIGQEPYQWLAAEVLRFSIQRRTKVPLEIQELNQLPIKLNFKVVKSSAFCRFFIPEACNYEGKAIYLDADILVLDNIQKLYELPLQGKGALARPVHEESQSGYYTSVMLLDCAHLKNWNVKLWSGLVNVQSSLYHDTIWGMPKGLNGNDFGDLPREWNELDDADSNTKIIHFTNIQTNPWKKAGHPHAKLFLKELKAAIDAEEIPIDAIEREIAQGAVYPTILDDLKTIDK